MRASLNYKLLEIRATAFFGTEKTGDRHVNCEAPRQTPQVQSPARAQRILEQSHLVCPVNSETEFMRCAMHASHVQRGLCDQEPFIWAATVEDIVQSISPARTKLEQIEPGSQSRTHLRKTLLAVTVRYHSAA